MEYDEIVFAVGELYLKYRKQQQIINDLGKEAQEKGERVQVLESEKEELERFLAESNAELEKLRKPKGGRK